PWGDRGATHTRLGRHLFSSRAAQGRFSCLTPWCSLYARRAAGTARACANTAAAHMLRVRMGRTDSAAVLFKRVCTMATTVKQMKAAARSRAGKGAARAERGAGRVPGVIYGDGKPPLNVSVDHADLKQRIYAGRFLTTIYELDVDGTKERVIPRDFQLDPVKDLPVHVDFLRLGEGAQIRVRIPVHIIN